MMIPTLLGISIVVFLFIRLIPGDIVLILAGARSDIEPAQREVLRHNLGLDRPLVVQYLDWLWGVLRGDLGVSLKTGRPIRHDIVTRLPVTIELTILAMLIGLAIGIPTGIIAALKRGTRTELAAQSAGLLGLSVPDFWIGTLFLLVASRYFGWYPGARYVSFFDDPLANLAIFILPALAVGIGLSASLMRMTRSSLLEVMASGYIVTARGKGLCSATPSRTRWCRSSRSSVSSLAIFSVGSCWSRWSSISPGLAGSPSMRFRRGTIRWCRPPCC